VPLDTLNIAIPPTCASLPLLRLAQDQQDHPFGRQSGVGVLTPSVVATAKSILSKTSKGTIIPVSLNSTLLSCVVVDMIADFNTQIECPKCLITFERLDNLFRHVTVTKCQRLKEEYWQYKRQADMDLDRRWHFRQSPAARADAPTPKHDFGDHAAVHSDSTGQSSNHLCDVAAASRSTTQTGADSSCAAESADNWKVNEARELSSLAEPSATRFSYEESCFPMKETHNPIDESSWPSDSASVLNFGMLHHHGKSPMKLSPLTCFRTHHFTRPKQSDL